MITILITERILCGGLTVVNNNYHLYLAFYRTLLTKVSVFAGLLLFLCFLILSAKRGFLDGF